MNPTDPEQWATDPQFLIRLIVWFMTKYLQYLLHSYQFGIYFSNTLNTKFLHAHTQDDTWRAYLLHALCAPAHADVSIQLKPINL